MKHLFIGIALTLLMAFILSQCIQPKDSNDLFVRTKTEKFSKGTANTSIELTQSKLDSILIKQERYLKLDIPYQDTVIHLNLTRLDLGDYQVQTSDKGYINDLKKSLHYYGNIIGENESIVSFSLDETNVTGLISSNIFGTISIAKVNNSKTSYLVYNSNSEQNPITFDCATKDEMFTVPKVEKLKKAGKKNEISEVASKCITQDYEVDYAHYTYFNGNIQAITNFVTSMFAPTKIIYQNIGVTFQLGKIYIWSTPDGYSSNTAEALNQLVNKRSNDKQFTGTFVQLLCLKTGGALGGIAYVGALCNSNIKFSVVQDLPSFAAYPNFSWDVEAMSHEIGHNLGSPHTQSCSWPGGAIDGCVAQEGDCPRGPIPAPGKGTIMSYCHLTSVGINFVNGFGPLPTALILNNINNSPCITCSVVVTPTCTDGIKNGDETGIDCGGSCKPCAIIDPSVNIAISAKAFQSSEYGGYPASNAIDGKMNTFNHTNAEVSPWLYLDLGAIKDIKNVKVYARQDCCNGRTRNLKVWAFNDMLPIVGDYNQPNPVFSQIGYLQPNQSLDIPVNAKARYIKIQCQALNGATYLHIGELEVYQNGGSVVCKDSTVTSIVKVTKDSLVYSTIKVCK